MKFLKLISILLVVSINSSYAFAPNADCKKEAKILNEEDRKNGLENHGFLKDENFYETICELNKALRSGDKNLVAEMMFYPIERLEPLKPIQNSQELVKHYDEFFDDKIIKLMIETTSHPRSFSIENASLHFVGDEGMLRISDKKIITLYKTKKQEELAANAMKDLKAKIHPSANKFNTAFYECTTSKFYVRIHDVLDDDKDDWKAVDKIIKANSREMGYSPYTEKARYISWKKGSDISLKPDIIIKGFMQVEGSGHYKSFYFKNGEYFYAIDDERTPDNPGLKVEKNGKIIMQEPCSNFN
jgi:hypothetical protein